ncbi:MAG TPA: protein kinase [Dictyobacter sp.]|jgi:serine/threonine protein kinase|nr:protein kinase [Dictyobacter sp.]
MIETVPSGTILHGRYRIERVLGSGGFGHVYLGLDQTTNQQYAVKEYLVTGASGQEQLKHEARVLSQLHHPNLPAFQDAFIEQGRYYVVLNYIEGHDLTDLVRLARQQNTVISLPQVLYWVLSICDAVMFMHSQRPIVIHRDIKPDNIRIKSDGTAVLVDLGNAKAVADGARTLFFIRHQGTPGYAPPEQYPGGTGTDARSDVYAIGGTLYFALTAQEPPSVSARNQSIQQGRPNLPTLQEHLANNPPEESPEEIAARQFRLGVSKPAKPAPRHSRHIAQLGMIPPQVLNQLNYIIQRSLALKPQERYQYVAEFARDLKTVIAALPNPPGPPQGNNRPQNPNHPHAAPTGTESAQQNPSSPSSTQPMENNKALKSCPRCGTSTVVQATFCPRCGQAYTQPPVATAAAQSYSNPNMAQVHPQMRQQVQAAYPAAASAHNAGLNSSVPHPSSAQNQMQSFQNPGMPGANAYHAQPAATMQNQSSGPTFANLKPKHLLLILGILIVLAIIIFIIISHHSGTTATLFYSFYTHPLS